MAVLDRFYCMYYGIDALQCICNSKDSMHVWSSVAMEKYTMHKHYWQHTMYHKGHIEVLRCLLFQQKTMVTAAILEGKLY